MPVFRLLGSSMPVSGFHCYVLSPLGAAEKVEFGFVALRHRFRFVVCFLAKGHEWGAHYVLRFSMTAFMC